MRRIYIAGPMTGHEDFNFPAFHAAAGRFRQAGWHVANPAENFGGRTDLARETYLRADLTMLARCDAIAMLPGWDESKGAKVEYMLGRELGMEIFDAESLQPLADAPTAVISLISRSRLLKVLRPDEGILDEAKRLTSDDRQADYGHPRDDFFRTAHMWTGILSGKLREGETIAASEIPLCMIAVKLARQAHLHKRDNLVDIAGYARTASMVAGDE
jgi:hypothetical protein